MNNLVIAGSAGVGTLLIAAKARQDMIQGMQTPFEVTPLVPVSIIIKNLNEGLRIGECIESILNQNVIKQHPGLFDVLVVDGGSEDNSVEIIRRYPVKLIVTKRGVINQKNVGIKNTKGEIVVFTDSDSYYPPYWLAKALAAFDEDVVFVHTSFLYEDKSNLGMGLVSMVKNIVPMASGGGQLARRSFFEETGLFDENYDCVRFSRVAKEEEWNVVSRASSIGRVVYQQNNPFITPPRRLYIPQLQHVCIKNPANQDCKFAMDVGSSRF